MSHVTLFTDWSLLLAITISFLLPFVFCPLHRTEDVGLNIPRVIINQLKWLDRVMDSKVVIFMIIGSGGQSHRRHGRCIAALVFFFFYFFVFNNTQEGVLSKHKLVTVVYKL